MRDRATVHAHTSYMIVFYLRDLTSLWSSKHKLSLCENGLGDKGLMLSELFLPLES